MSYWSELRANWRPLLAATIGVGSGMSLAGTIDSAMAPHLIAGNHWAKADYAFVGTLGIFSSLAFPFIGRLADVLGVRWTALIGQIVLPLSFFCYSRMDGSLGTYMMIFIVQGMICVTTTATVYSRLAVQYIKKARGLALAIVVSGGAIGQMLLGKPLNDYVEAHGWREGYVALIVFSIIATIIFSVLMPSERKPDATTTTNAKRHNWREDYPMIFRTRTFWILAISMFLCNLPFTLVLRQLKLLMEANGVSGADAGIMLSALPVGMLLGRLFAGLIIDRVAPYLVAFTMMAIPSLGLFVIATDWDSFPILIASVVSFGFAFGAEGDIMAYLIARHFGVRIYSSVSGLITAITSLSISSGAFILSRILAAGGNYNTFLIVTGTAVIIGAILLLFTRNEPVAEGAG